MAQCIRSAVIGWQEDSVSESGVLITGYNVHPPSRPHDRGPLARFLVRRVVRWLIAAILLFALLSIPAFPELDRVQRCLEAEFFIIEVDGQVYFEPKRRFFAPLPAECS
jgi:hypothetical protein